VIIDVKPSSPKQMSKSSAKGSQMILHGSLNGFNGLWIMHLTPHPTTITPAKHNSAMASTTMVEQMQFLHALLFSPVLLTLY
jgi:uncharacterized Zn-finger protein